MPGPDELQPFVACAQALEAHLSRYFPATQFLHAFVPQQATPEVWRELTRRCPFLGLSWGGIQPDANSGRDLAGSCRWSLSLVTRHGRVRERYLGDSTTPALLQMAWMAATVLHGHALQTPEGLALGTITVTGVDNAYAAGWGEGQVAIAEVAFTTPLPAPGDAFAGVLQELLQVGVVWDFPTLAAVTDTYERPA